MTRRPALASVLARRRLACCLQQETCRHHPRRGRGPHRLRRPDRDDGRRPAHHRRSHRRGRGQDHVRRQQGGRAQAAGRRHGAEGPRRQDADARLHRRPCACPAVRSAGRRRQPARPARWQRQHDRRCRRQAEDLRRRPRRRQDRLDLRRRLRRRPARPPPDARRPRQGLDDRPGHGDPHLGPLRGGQHARPEDDRLRRQHAQSRRRRHPPRGRRQDPERRARGTGRDSAHGEGAHANHAGGQGRLPEARPRTGQELRLHHRQRRPHVRRRCMQSWRTPPSAVCVDIDFIGWMDYTGRSELDQALQHDLFQSLPPRRPQGHARRLAAGPHGLAHRRLPDAARWPAARLQGLSRHSRHQAGRGLSRRGLHQGLAGQGPRQRRCRHRPAVRGAEARGREAWREAGPGDPDPRPVHPPGPGAGS